MLVVSNICYHAVYHTGRKPSDAPDGVAPVHRRYPATHIPKVQNRDKNNCIKSQEFECNLMLLEISF